MSGQIIRDAPAADQNDLTDGTGSQTRLTEKLLCVAQARHKADAVTGAQAKLARGDVDLLIAAFDRADQKLGAYQRRQLHQRPTLKNGAFGQPEV